MTYRNKVFGVIQKGKEYLKYEYKRHNLVNLGHFKDGTLETKFKYKVFKVRKCEKKTKIKKIKSKIR